MPMAWATTRASKRVHGMMTPAPGAASNAAVSSPLASGSTAPARGWAPGVTQGVAVGLSWQVQPEPVRWRWPIATGQPSRWYAAALSMVSRPCRTCRMSPMSPPVPGWEP